MSGETKVEVWSYFTMQS